MDSPESSAVSTAEPAAELAHGPTVLRVNGEAVVYHGPAAEPLIWGLRDLGFLGTKPGCGIGVCGVCTVLLDGRPTRSCITSTADAVGHDIMTIEGMAGGDEERLHPFQQAFVDLGAPQCGWCMSGQVLTAVALLAAHPDPTDDEIDDTMSDVLCRCGAYGRIRAAIHAASSTGATAERANP
jgi:aerobic-type carbon monoxide dehydrogenase small subunit (CoxS/CutS family)